MRGGIREVRLCGNWHTCPEIADDLRVVARRKTHQRYPVLHVNEKRRKVLRKLTHNQPIIDG